MFRIAAVLSVRIRSLLSYAPTNLLIAWIDGRRRYEIGAWIILLWPAYWTVTILLGLWVRDGAPGWLNLLVLLTFWNGIKFGGYGIKWLVLALTPAAFRDRKQRRLAAVVR